jgi:hypothetical protein
MYKAAYYEAGLSPLDFGMRPNPATHNPGRTYRFYSGPEMLHPFGSGLKISAWDAELICPSESAVVVNVASPVDPHDGDVVVLTVEAVVENQGPLEGSEVVMLFARPPGGGAGGVQIHSLVGFERVSAAVGEAARVQFQLCAKHFRVAGTDGEWSVRPGAWTLTLEPDARMTLTDAASYSLTVTVSH